MQEVPMRIISKTIYSQSHISLPDPELDAGDVLFLDIATTGIRRADSRVYLIGCICRQPGLSDRLHLQAAGRMAAHTVV